MHWLQDTSPTWRPLRRWKSRCWNTSQWWRGPSSCSESSIPFDGPASMPTLRWVSTSPIFSNFKLPFPTYRRIEVTLAEAWSLANTNELGWTSKTNLKSMQKQKWTNVESSNKTQVPNDRSLWLIGLKKPTKRKIIHVRSFTWWCVRSKLTVWAFSWN